MSHILHIDINSYFATLLQQENPFLRGRPIGVVKGLGRTCIIAASKEAKAKGVKTGCRLADALELAPDLITVPVNFTQALANTKKMQQIFHSIAPNVMIFSLDEAFIDLSDCLKYVYQDAWEAACLIQKRIKAELGEWVTCNIGIAENRLLAKMSGEVAPPDTITEVTEENKDALLASTPFSSVCGVGMRLERKLRRLGATTPYMIRFCTDQELEASVGPFWAPELKKIAYGEESFTLRLPDRIDEHMKSVSRSITGYKLCSDEADIKRILFNLVEEVTYKVRRMDLAGRYVWIGLNGHERRWSAHKTLKFPIRHSTDMFHILYDQLYASCTKRFPVIKFMVGMSSLQPMSLYPIPLLPDWQKQEAVSKALDKLTDKYGLFTVRSGLMNDPTCLIAPEVTGFLGDKQYQLKLR